MGVDDLINKLRNTLNELINRKNRRGTSTRTTELLNKVLKTLKTIENCISCKDSINEIENCIAELGKQKKDNTIFDLDEFLLKLNKILFISVNRIKIIYNNKFNKLLYYRAFQNFRYIIIYYYTTI